MKALKGHLCLSAFLLLLTVLVTGKAQAAIYWVGDNTAACDAVSASSTIGGPLLFAAFSPEDDEIRLTKTINYLGDTGNINLVNWNPATTGKLTISGGYSDCNSGISGKTQIGGNGTIISITTTTQPASDVTFKNIELINVPGRAVSVSGSGAILTLDGVVIADNESGAMVTEGGALSVQSDSIIEDNLSIGGGGTFDFSVEKGGGIYCTGSGSQVSLSGDLKRNGAKKGGGMYIADGCVVEIKAGAVIEGSYNFAQNIFTPSAEEGGGLYVDDGGTVVNGGGASRALIRNHLTKSHGAGIYAREQSLILLLDTRISNTTQLEEGQGTAIYATDGGTDFPQVILDRTANCTSGAECSLIDGALPPPNGSVIYASNSQINLNRTILKSNGSLGGNSRKYIVHADNGSIINLDTVGLIKNKATSQLFVTNGADLNLKSVTAAANAGITILGTVNNYFARVEGDLIKGDGELDIRNSLLNDNFGLVGNSDKVSGECNYIRAGGWPAGIYNGPGVTFGVPVFKDTEYRLDANQTEPGTIVLSGALDACKSPDNQSTNRDIEYDLRPVDNPNSPNAGIGPDIANTTWDVGYDEVILSPEARTINITFAGSGNGTVANDRIADCTANCSRQITPGGVLTLLASPDPGNSFINWSGCESTAANGCTVDLTSSDASVTVNFNNVPPPNDVFADGFEE